MENLLDEVKRVLEVDQSLISDGQLLKNAVIERALKVDPALVKMLLGSESIRKHFFSDISGALVFDKVKFQEFVSNKNFFPDSYTKYSNKIGLSGGKTSSMLHDVVLEWPFKDCVLEGGMTREQKRLEVFWNTTLSPNDISRLFEPKVLTGWEMWDKDAVRNNRPKQVKHPSDSDNLIIKGNNLLALHSIKGRYAGKVRLIYIDPPYNRKGDSFSYNDSFSHSSWLTFMRNRLEVSRELLADDGVIFVQCDDTEQAYLKVLMDEIFGSDMFLSNSIVIMNRSGIDYGSIARIHEYLLIYSKGIRKLNPRRRDGGFSHNDAMGGFEPRELRNRNIRFNSENRQNLYYPVYVNPKKRDENGLYEVSLQKRAGFVETWPLKSQGVQTVWRWGKDKMQENLKDSVRAKMKRDCTYMIVEKYRGETTLQRSVWDDTLFINERGTKHLKNLFGGKVFDYPKSEFLIMRVIELATDPGDIVLDYHLGSGTTAAVCHKMGRRYIGIEQMDYTDTVPVQRLKKVIGGEGGGASQELGWNGGGSFVYVKLAQWNGMFIDRIRAARNAHKIDAAYRAMSRKGYFRHVFDGPCHKSHRDEFMSLPLEQQKRLLIECLDMNHIYVNVEEMDDGSYGVGNDDRRLTGEFYGCK